MKPRMMTVYIVLWVFLMGLGSVWNVSQLWANVDTKQNHQSKNDKKKKRVVSPRNRQVTRGKKRLRRKKKTHRYPDLRPKRMLHLALLVKSSKGAQAQGSSMTLTALLSLVAKQNIDLKILKKRLSLVETARVKAWTILLPTLGVVGNYTRNQQEVEMNGVVITPLDQLSLNLQMNWTFMNFQSFPIVHSVALQKKQLQFQVKQMRRDLFFSVVRGYYNILLAQGFIDIAKNSAQLARQNLKTAEIRRKAGVTTPITVSQAQLDVSRSEQSWQSARNSLKNTQLAMALLLGQPTFDHRVIRPSAPILPSGKKNDWQRQARQVRYELKSQKVAIGLAKEQQRKVWMSFLPTGSANARLAITNTTGFSGENAQWSVGVNLNWNLFAGGSRFVAVREAKLNLQRAMLSLQKVQQQVDNDVRKSVIGLNNANLSVALAKRNMTLARQTYQLQRQRYKTGLATPLAVSDSMNRLFSAEISYLREELNQELAVLGLRRSVGVFSFPKK